MSDVLDYIRANLPDPPQRVLEVGAGQGEMAEALRADGYDVVAIDPAASTPTVAPIALIDVDEPPRSFDAAIAVVSLHHVEPLAESFAHLAELVRPGGVLVVDEFDVERFDEDAAEWWSARHAEHPHPGETVAGVRGHLHPVDRIREQLGEWFDLSPVTRGPYLYRFQLSEALRAEEEQCIAAGSFRPTGARFTGRCRS